MRTLRKFFGWLFAPENLVCDDPLASALPAYDARPWPICAPRVGENYERYCRRARESRERAFLLEVWKVTAEPDDDGVWTTAVDQITRKRDGMLKGGLS